MSNEPPVRLNYHKDGIATLVINRPAQRNALDRETRRQLRTLAAELRLVDDLRAVVLRGAGGKAFASGGDLRELGEMNAADAVDHFEEFETTLRAIEELPVPVVAMIDGYALGGGCELAAACDLRVASDRSQFGVPIGRLGHTLDKRNIRRLLRLISPADLKALLMTDLLLSGMEAKRLGLVNAVVPHMALEGYVYAMAARIASSAPLGVRTSKRLIDEVVAEASDPHPDDFAGAASLFDTGDFAEGVAAFLEKREPSFMGQ